jgi:hypothetical protein
MRPDSRFFVPDLTPQARPALRNCDYHVIFVAESPHINEVEPEKPQERRPLCGAAGRQWWSMLGDLLEHDPSSDVGLQRMLSLCCKHQFAVMNAVQYPLDPKIAASFPKADPIKNLGFAKASGPYSYKKMKKSEPVKEVIQSLRERLCQPGLEKTPIICLGNDAEWFVQQALADDPKLLERVRGKLPHPSAWWRRQGVFKKIAKEKLEELFQVRKSPS